jgi:TRAP-type mannitol/chloroaromatic compound transport system substrate-binding protein
VAGRTELRPFSQPIMEACLKASNEVNAETAARSQDFQMVLESIIDADIPKRIIFLVAGP